jgi:hypothetical protein
MNKEWSMQIYFLSIVVNIIISMILMSEDFGEKISIFKKVENAFQGMSKKFLLAFSAMLIALIQLVAPIEGIPFLGDFLPMVAGFSLGGALLVTAIKERTDVENQAVDKLEKVMLHYKGFIGAGGIIVSLLHFILPTLPIL